MKKFTRCQEDFQCEVCGAKVHGDGYTDHCPNCLAGKHVDAEFPGDRRSNCGGRMEPRGWRRKNGQDQLRYVCLRCGKEFWCRTDKRDDQERLVVIFSRPTREATK